MRTSRTAPISVSRALVEVEHVGRSHNVVLMSLSSTERQALMIAMDQMQAA
ncbi:MAG: hypothetical protein M3132_07320 [Actinomycetia bacterium]|nr:hypothetical protein [Actinomycetes bacterium]